MMPERCVECVYRKQIKKCDDPAYLAIVREILNGRTEEDTAPYISHLCKKAYEEFRGVKADFKERKKHFNELVLSIEDKLEEKMAEAEDPLLLALLLSRAGNYIDFGTVQDVNDDMLIKLLDEAKPTEQDLLTYTEFKAQCEKAKSFLLICDNCGEVVLDKIMLRQLQRRYPELSLNILVRGGETDNDADLSDAVMSGIDRLGKVYTTGFDLEGIRLERLPAETAAIMEQADVVLAKGQANYECIGGHGRKRFHMFLCKCEQFMDIFDVPRFTGMFIEM